MSLSECEKGQVRQRLGLLNNDVNSDNYVYDKIYGSKYTLDALSLILKSINLGLAESEINLLKFEDKLQITKKTIVLFGKNKLLEAELCSDSALKFGVLCLMWGYASQGYGLYRIGKILEDNFYIDKLSKNISGSLSYLKKNNVRSAYLMWEGANHIPGIGESFFTKILYFLCKVIDESNPKVLIKDSITSNNAAIFFGIKRLRSRGIEFFIDYIYMLQFVAKEKKITAEKVEEFLFSNTMMISSMKRDQLLEYSFPFASDYINEFYSFGINQSLYNNKPSSQQGNQLMMLVADGKAKTELPEMTYDSKIGDVQENFYSNQRTKIITNANTEANKTNHEVPTYILTTGFGAIPITVNIPYYNIPGEKAIKYHEYWEFYIDSIKRILPKSEEGKIIAVSIVYYAGKSKESFRTGIYKLIKKMSEDNSLKQKYEIHFCMYGGRQHSLQIWKGNWGSLVDIFTCLSNKDFRTISIMKSKWLEDNKNISPFFVYF